METFPLEFFDLISNLDFLYVCPNFQYLKIVFFYTMVNILGNGVKQNV